MGRSILRPSPLFASVDDPSCDLSKLYFQVVADQVIAWSERGRGAFLCAVVFSVKLSPERAPSCLPIHFASCLLRGATDSKTQACVPWTITVQMPKPSTQLEDTPDEDVQPRGIKRVPTSAPLVEAKRAKIVE